MIKEIYIRDEKDPNFQPGIIDHDNELESVISQIKMILGTKEGEVLGAPYFGLDLEYLVFNTKINAERLQEKIFDAINEGVSHSSNIFIENSVSFGKSASGFDYCVVDIIINGNKTIGFLISND